MAVVTAPVWLVACDQTIEMGDTVYKLKETV
jgi:hypothetical protein